MAFSKLSDAPLTDSQFSLLSAKVLSAKGKQFRVLTVTGVFQEAVLAASCIIAPSVGSQVLIADGESQHFILAVLTYPASTLTLEAKAIELHSHSLKMLNKTTEIKTNQLRFDVRRLVTLAKRAYFQFSQLWQKTDAAYLESKHYKLKTKYLAEQTEGLRFSEAEVITDKAKVSSIQADKFLVN